MKKIYFMLFSLLLSVVCLFSSCSAYSSSQKEDITVSLEKILDISDLSTVDYVYNSIVEVKDEKGKTAYYVSYEGTVTAGINFEKIRTEINEETKTITITLPSAEIQDYIVNINSLDYMFFEKSANSPTVAQEAYHRCLAQLQEKATQETMLFEIAQNNAKNAIDAFMQPLIGYSGYTIILA